MSINLKSIRTLGIALLIATAFAIAPAAEPQDTGITDIMKSFSFRALGPARQNGRVLHVVVNERIPTPST